MGPSVIRGRSKHKSHESGEASRQQTSRQAFSSTFKVPGTNMLAHASLVFIALAGFAAAASVTFLLS